MGGITVQQILGQFTNGPSGPSSLVARLEDDTRQIPEKMGPSLFAEAEDGTLKKPETVVEDRQTELIKCSHRRAQEPSQSTYLRLWGPRY